MQSDLNHSADIEDETGDLHNAQRAVLQIEKRGLFKCSTQLFSIGKHLLFKAEAVSVLQTGTFDIWTKDPDCLSLCHGLSTLPELEQTRWSPVGSISSPGLLFDRSVARDQHRGAKAVVVYYNTSRTGELMNMKVAIPRIHKSPPSSLCGAISTLTNLPMDCAQLIVEHLDLFWTEALEQSDDAAHCHRLIRRHSQKNSGKAQVLRNKLPTWNSQLNAYTLEFGGRALIPSVHNFQLVDDEERVVLQLGKSSEITFNVDFSFPLTPYQAFCICLSVVDRTFVWD